MKIVLGVCGFGYGHSTRQRPILEGLLARGHEVILITNDQSFQFFTQNYPKVRNARVYVPAMHTTPTGLDFAATANDPRNAQPEANPAFLMKFLTSNTQRRVKITVPGPFTMSQQAQIDLLRRQPREGGDGLREGRERRDQGPARRGRRHRADRRALPAGAAGRGAPVRACRAEHRAGRRHRQDGRAHLLRLCGHHPCAGRTAIRSCRRWPAAAATRSPSRPRSRTWTPACSRRCRARRSSWASSTCPIRTSRRPKPWPSASAAR